jgi:hypothetical protein
MKRLLSFFATMMWCVVAVLWNVAVIGSVVRAIGARNIFGLLVMVPFVLIGLFLLVVLYASVLAGISHLFKIGRASPPLTNAVPPDKLPMLQPAPPIVSRNEFNLKDSPIVGGLVIIVAVNWFLFFGISMYLGGDAVGTFPSKDGFIVISHGRHTVVSEQAWVFSLFYSAATLLLSPLVVLLFGALQTRRQTGNMKWPVKLFVGVFLLVWFVGWYSSIGGSVLRSRKDWQKLKHSTPALQPSRPPP